MQPLLSSLDLTRLILTFHAHYMPRHMLSHNRKLLRESKVLDQRWTFSGSSHFHPYVFLFFFFALQLVYRTALCLTC